ncbi:uncharacterized protein METZ01_LOCUS346396, partial [marine metagenome]
VVIKGNWALVSGKSYVERINNYVVAATLKLY